MENQGRPIVRCPVCFRQVFNNYSMTGEDGDKTSWYWCFCGSFFHTNSPVEKCKIYDHNYRDEYNNRKDRVANPLDTYNTTDGVRNKLDYYIRTYAQLIEEITWGRKSLDVGYCEPYLIDKLKERGWVATGIDILPSHRKEIQGDFEDYNFGINRYDLITMIDVLQSFDNPVGALRKAWKLLQPNGILFVATPDTDQINLGGMHSWKHWDSKHNRVYFSGKAFKDEAIKAGFDVIYFWRNVNARFMTTQQFHAILQKPCVRLDHQQMEEIENGKITKSNDTK